MFKSRRRHDNERALAKLEDELDTALGATRKWPSVNCSAELYALNAAGYCGPLVISSYYEMSPAARAAALAIDLLMEH